MRIAISGTRSITGADMKALETALHRLPQGAELITGACIGIDAMAAYYWRTWGNPVHTVVPADRSRVTPMWPKWCTSAEELPEGMDYRERNRRMVYLADCLIAFPAYAEHDERSQRSGTWMTVRLARTKGIPVDVHQLRD